MAENAATLVAGLVMTAGVGVGVGAGVAVGMGVGLGVGDALTTVTCLPCCSIHHAVCKYGNVPVLLKVRVKVAPWLRIPESQIPLGAPGIPEVVLWKVAAPCPSHHIAWVNRYG